MRTKQQIEEKIQEIADRDYFTEINIFEGGYYSLHEFSEDKTKQTLTEFAEWLLNEK